MPTKESALHHPAVTGISQGKKARTCWGIKENQSETGPYLAAETAPVEAQEAWVQHCPGPLDWHRTC